MSNKKRLRYSPEVVVIYFNEHGRPSETRLCGYTIYNYVGKDIFLNMMLKDLPRKGVKPKRRKRRAEKRLSPSDRKRICQRLEESTLRSAIGHWKMDCIESIKSDDPTCLLTLIDPYSRKCYIFKMRRQNKEAVLRMIDSLERKPGSKAFRDQFKSITVYNGSEFPD